MADAARAGLSSIKLTRRGFRDKKTTNQSLKHAIGIHESENATGCERTSNVFDIDLSQIVTKQQVREDFRNIEELAESIKQFGILNPPTVKWSVNDGRYVVIAGERRIRAARIAGLQCISCIIQNVDELRALEIQLIENVQREDLNPIEEARGYRDLMRLAACTARDVGKRLGKHETTITRALRLLDYPKDIQSAIANGKIKKSVARELARIEDPAVLRAYLDRALSGNLSVTQAIEAAAGCHHSVRRREVRKSSLKPKRQLTFDGGDGFEVVICYKKKHQVQDLSYHDIEQAFNNVQAEVRHRITNRVNLNWEASITAQQVTEEPSV